MAIFIADKVDFSAGNITRGNEAHYIRETIYHEDIQS